MNSIYSIYIISGINWHSPRTLYLSVLLLITFVNMHLLHMDFSCPNLCYKNVYLESAGGRKLEMTKGVCDTDVAVINIRMSSKPCEV
ncbi:MAG: hypothetical protein IPG02_18785 [Ignavibacteria bacterium]|nr:hypothetical protein [Ignavibacteria bacterium]